MEKATKLVTDLETAALREMVDSFGKHTASRTVAARYVYILVKDGRRFKGIWKDSRTRKNVRRTTVVMAVANSLSK